jgi:hypothetical protein
MLECRPERTGNIDMFQNLAKILPTEEPGHQAQAQALEKAWGLGLGLKLLTLEPEIFRIVDAILNGG